MRRMIVPVQVGTLAQCQWCEKFIVRSDADVLCIDCSMDFTNRLIPVDTHFWDEPEAAPSAVNDDFGDSVYGGGDVSGVAASSNDSESTRASDGNPVTAGGCDWDSERAHAIMYEKIAEVWHLERRALPLEDDTWAYLVHARALSKCWVESPCGDLVKFSFPELRSLSRFFVWDVPLGFVVINLARRKCFHVSSLQHVEQCRLRSAIHYLRSYQDQTVGFLLSAAEQEQQELAIIQCSHGPWTFSEKARFHKARAMLDLMLRIVIGKYEHVSFWRDKDA